MICKKTNLFLPESSMTFKGTLVGLSESFFFNEGAILKNEHDTNV